MYADEAAYALQKILTHHKKTLALAESCTGGAIAARLVTVPGASHYFLGSIVAYSDAWKKSFLGVEQETMVSEEAAREMVQGLFAKTRADFALAITGLLGPKEGLSSFYIAWGERKEEIEVELFTASQDRLEGIDQAVETSLSLLLDLVGGRFAS
jgi:PncC family amidohydrolase